MSSRRFRVTMDGVMHEIEVEEIFEGSKAAPAERNVVAAMMQQRTAAPTVPATPAVPTVPAAPVVQTKPQAGAGEGGEVVKSPLQGKILSIKASVGNEVKAGDVLLLIEAMKMENEIVASQNGRVGQIYVKQGDSVAAGDALVLIK